ncbi:Glycoside hydrolase, family 12 [Plasmopara halstedii]|uniref:Glycoside hydrolase, family 12 n=1 Tax=Plasmopara halstedii TaxID=4781 RepID=A0A0P1AJ88_PLAHL|nr:Glycoside hydrolase, family 12 [Plasmopara halstedii]CEG41012.1 Glycoside hydrolase, family 12 [Plasmopara halstedii]|eukprot:XP_024577381.1 Glycoside hydrolase, family 12 [Plasmopara halstedii]
MKFCYPATIALTAVATIAQAADFCGPSRNDYDSIQAGQYKIYHGSGEISGQLCSAVDSFTDHTVAFHTNANIPETSSGGTNNLNPVTFAAAQLLADSKRVGEIKSIPVTLYHEYTFDGKLSANVGLSLTVGPVDYTYSPLEILVWMTGYGDYIPASVTQSTDSVVIGGREYDRYRLPSPAKSIWYVPRMAMPAITDDLYPFINDSIFISAGITFNDYVHKVQAVTNIITAANAKLTVTNFTAEIL